MKNLYVIPCRVIKFPIPDLFRYIHILVSNNGTKKACDILQVW